MAVEYDWTWGPMMIETVNEIPDVITGIHYMCLAKDLTQNDKLMGKMTGIVHAPPVDPNNFISLSNVTSDIIQSWISQGLNVAEIQAQCASDLAELLTPAIKVASIPQGDYSSLTANVAVVTGPTG